MVTSNCSAATARDSISADAKNARPDATSAPPNESLLVGMILAFTALLYAPTLRFGFVYDDHLQIVQNPLVHSWRFVPEVFRSHVWEALDPGDAGNYYRPLNVLWFRINDALFGLRPVAWHATAILLHVVAVWLVYILVRRLSGKLLVALFAALLFAVHPMRHEVVGWISGTTESLWSVLFLLAFLAYLRSREGARWMVFSCALYAAALLAKEAAIMLPVVVFAHAAIYGNAADNGRPGLLGRRLSSAIKTAAMYAPVAIAYAAVRIAVLHGFTHTPSTLSWKELLFTLPSVLLFYAKQWFFPIQFAESYGHPMWFHFDLVHVLLPTIGLVAIVAFVWFWRSTLGQREVIFAVAWVTMLLLPSLDLFVFPEGELAHDRYFYLPSVGICLLLALAMDKLAHGAVLAGLPRKWLFATLAVVILLSYDTVKATSYWANDYRMFEHAYEVGPRSGKARNGYANELATVGDYSKALRIMQELIAEQPNRWESSFNLGHVFYQLGEFSTAEQYLKRAQQLDPAMPFPYLYLGLTYLRMNRFQDAEANLRQAVFVRPYEPFLHFSLASVLVIEAKCDEARAEFRQAQDLLPDMPHVQDQIDNCGKPKTN
ncbi:MAG: hypothetical protein DMG32_21375 [Acidobacteria bacterium]|nr:MAG: hypothetical protein DMG32_21375 [Acidobacteriota bacterium]